MSSGKAIGFFDSGVGGLTVMKAVKAAFPSESTLYLGDNTRIPYGPLPVETVRRYTLQCLDQLYRLGAKALVIACNTATAAALEAARERYDVPVIGVIGPTARAAARVAREKVGIMATEGTVKSGLYPRAINEVAPGLEVVQQPCPLLTPLVEAGEIDTRKSDTVLEGYLQPLRKAGVDTVVLGCTHYPFLRKGVERLMGPGVQVVESGPAVVAVLAELMAAGTLEGAAVGTSVHRLMTTGNPESFDKLAGILWPEGHPEVEVVELEPVRG